jgi:hypothetical protein
MDRLAPVAQGQAAARLDDQRRGVSGDDGQGLARSGQRAVQVALVPEDQRGLDHHPRDRLGVTRPTARLDRPRVEELGSGDVAGGPAKMGGSPVRREAGLQIDELLRHLHRLGDVAHLQRRVGDHGEGEEILRIPAEDGAGLLPGCGEAMLGRAAPGP